MHKCGLCRHAVSVCVSVTFVNSVKTNTRIFKIFSLSSSQAILVFRCQTVWNYSDGNPPPPIGGASNAGGVGRNRDSEPISGFTAYAVKHSSAVNLAATNHSEYITLVAGERPSLLMASWQETRTKYMTRSLNITPKTTLRVVNLKPK